MNPLRRAVHLFMETTRLDRQVDADAINRRRELWRSRRQPALSNRASSQWIGETIAAGKPAAIATLGRHECGTLAAHLGLRRFYKYTWAAPSYSEAGLAHTGVFPPTDEIYWRFSELMIERLRSLDGCALALHVGESQILADRVGQAYRLAHRSLEPYLTKPAWSAQLAGKRVLVIHPFEPSIRSQYSRRSLVWPGRTDVLPDFDLEISRSPHGFFRSGFNDWFAMQEWFEQRIEGVYRRSRFDVALIGCGASGLPLAVFVKKLGAIGIHVGDSLPALFGIRSGPAEEDAKLHPFMNDAWVRPHENELPPVLSP
ncbi:MAG TPA: hypothetical protein VHO24_08945 [Opitutaceae bacterium]|nr:hypothetical protein [Opitutaceae bacterium]